MYLEETDSGLGEASLASDGGEGGDLLASGDAGVGEEVSDFLLRGESSSDVLDIGLDTSLKRKIQLLSIFLNNFPVKITISSDFDVF